MKNTKIVKITTIYNETFITKLFYISRYYLETAHGRIDKDEIKDFAIIGEAL